MAEKKTLGQEFTKGLIKENPVLRLVLGTCPTLAVTTSVSSAIGMGASATAVLVCSNIVISLLRKVIPPKVRIPAYIVVIASFVTIVQMVVKAFLPDLDKSLGVYLPLITTNCAVLGVALTNAQNSYGFIESVVNGFATALGYCIAIILLAGIREHVEGNDVPHSWQGMPIVLVTAALMSISFFGFSGIM